MYNVSKLGYARNSTLILLIDMIKVYYHNEHKHLDGIKPN